MILLEMFVQFHKTLKPLHTFLDNHGAADVISYAKKYGPYNPIAKKNTALLEKVVPHVREQVVIVSPVELNTIALHKVKSDHEAIVTILQYIIKGQHVVYVPKASRSIQTVLAKAVNDELDFVARNSSKSKARARPEYSLQLDTTYPMYFGPHNVILKHWLLMSVNFKEFEKLFNRTYIFLTRVRCGWV